MRFLGDGRTYGWLQHSFQAAQTPAPTLGRQLQL